VWYPKCIPLPSRYSYRERVLFIGTPSVTLAQHCPSSQHPDSISVWRTREVVSGSFAPGYSSWEGGSYPRRATHVQSESPGESDCSQFPGGEWNFCSGLLVAVPRAEVSCFSKSHQDAHRCWPHVAVVGVEGQTSPPGSPIFAASEAQQHLLGSRG
jgi:hypothetical protein